jgi:galactokinase
MKLYDKNQSNGAVKHFAMIDGQMVAVIPVTEPESNHIAEVVPVASHKRTTYRVSNYKRRSGRCEDAPCCGCCD